MSSLIHAAAACESNDSLARVKILAPDGRTHRSAEARIPSTNDDSPDTQQEATRGYEWRSRWSWMGAPVVHVAFGADVAGKPHVARGVIAIGQRAIGGVAIGIVATGFIAIGLVALGVFSLGVVAIGLIAACGMNAAGLYAFGVVAAGWKVAGLAPFRISF